MSSIVDLDVVMKQILIDGAMSMKRNGVKTETDEFVIVQPLSNGEIIIIKIWYDDEGVKHITPVVSKQSVILPVVQGKLDIYLGDD